MIYTHKIPSAQDTITIDVRKQEDYLNLHAKHLSGHAIETDLEEAKWQKRAIMC